MGKGCWGHEPLERLELPGTEERRRGSQETLFLRQWAEVITPDV